MSSRQPITPPTLRGVLITTRFHGPTNYTGARFSASCKWHGDTIHRVYVSQDYKLDSEQNHLAAAQKLLDKRLNTPEDLNPSQGLWRITANAFNDPDCNHWLVCKDWWVKESIQQLAGFHKQLPAVQS